MDKKQVITVIFAVVIILAIVFLVVTGRSGTPAPSGMNQSAPAPVETQTSSPEISTTQAPVPPNVIVPSKNSVNVPANVAVPLAVAPAAPGTSASYRSFNINADGGAFAPDTIVVNLNDVVNIYMTAVDASYDFTQPDYGFSLTVPQGVTKRIQFSASSAGKFTFYCSSCGGPAKGPVGYIIVK